MPDYLSNESIEAILFDEKRIRIHPKSTQIGGAWQGALHQGIPTAWDMPVIKFFYEQTLKYSNPIMLDIGANTGSFALLGIFNKELTCHAFEPAPDTFSLLERNIKLNDLSNKTIPYKLALTDKKETAVMKFPKSGKDSGMACIGNPLRYNEWTEINVETDRLDSFAMQSGIKRADLIKIDTEGCELFVLQGGSNFIREHHPDILLEYWGPNTMQFDYMPEEIIELLGSWGYTNNYMVGREDRFFPKPQKASISIPGLDFMQPITNKGFDIIKIGFEDKFARWIEFLSKSQNRLYYKDQTPASLIELVEISSKHKPTKIIELGTLSGLSLRTWVETNPNAEITAVDLSFSHLHESLNIIPLDLTRVKLLEQDILTVNFSKLWSETDNVLLYIDAHDLENVPIMKYLIDRAFPILPSGSIVVIDDLWYSPERINNENCAEIFNSIVFDSIDRLQCFTGYYADYRKGGSFFGFQEVVPLMEWVKNNNIELNFKPGIKSVYFTIEKQKAGRIDYNPLANFVLEGGRSIPDNIPAEDLMNQAAIYFSQGKLTDAFNSITEAMRFTGNIIGGDYYRAICLARLGRLIQAKEALILDLSTVNPHKESLMLLRDIESFIGKDITDNPEEVIYSDELDVKTNNYNNLTIFTMPKPMSGHIEIIQRNAFISWTKLNPKPDIFLTGNENGIKNVAEELKLVHLTGISENEFGTPLVNSIFTEAEEESNNNIMMYINADIIIINDVMKVVEKVRQKFDTFLIVGQRIDLDVNDVIDFNSPEWKEYLLNFADESGVYHSPTGIDYFIYSGDPWGEIPPFALGRTAWDGWLVYQALENGVPVIDATEEIRIIHQNHDYAHVAGGKSGAWTGEEARKNVSMAGGYSIARTVTDATWRFSNGELIESPCGWNVLKGQDYTSRLLLQGFSFKSEGKYNRAISCFEPVKTSSPEAIVEINKLKEILKLKNGKDTEQIQTPVIMIQDNAADLPKVENFKTEAEILFKRGDNKAAIDKLTSYLGSNPNDSEAVLIASQILESMGLITEARDVCLYYYMLNPTNGEITDKYYYYDELLEKQGEIQQWHNTTEISFTEPTVRITGNIKKINRLTGRTFSDAGKDRSKLKFLQVHTFYDFVINNLYKRTPGLESKSFNEQIYALLEDGFSAVHLISPYMNESGYEPGLVIANCAHSQHAWLSENGYYAPQNANWLYDAVRLQIETFRPDVLYLSDPITFDSVFIRTLRHQPSIILGWRAAPIPSTTDWRSFDCILSALSATRETALKIGAKSAKNFFPGFPAWIYDEIKNIEPVYDVVFCGQWTENQHRKRNDYLQHIAGKSMTPSESFSLAYYLSGDTGIIPPEVAKFNHGARFGVEMHKALRSGKIAVDARSEMYWVNPATGENIDIAKTETANMRIFETTGSGVFLLTEHFDNISEFFKPGYEIETFADKSELTDKIKYYLRHDSQRETIARRGFDRCMGDYSISKRALELDKIIKSFIIRKPESNEIEGLFDNIVPESAGPAELTQKAIDLLNNNENLEALEIFDKLIQSDKKRFELNYGKAVALTRLGRKTEAIEALTILLKKSPKHKFAKILLEELQFDKSGPEYSADNFIPEIDESPRADNEEMLEFIDQAVRALNEGDHLMAFNILNYAKSLRTPVEGLDFLRALCFVGQEEIFSAREALREELRAFPGNNEAVDLLNNLNQKHPETTETIIHDQEFKSLYDVIKPYTMLSPERLFSLFTLAKKVCEAGIPGNFAECGVAAGGSSALLAYIIKKYSRIPRRLFSFDSFEGMPKPGDYDMHDGKAAEDTGWGTGTCYAEEASLLEICSKLGVADVVTPVKGYFNDTLPKMKDHSGMLAILHLDGNWYESTKTVLENLYDRLSDDAIIQIDDYGYWEGCRKAVHEFMETRGLGISFNRIDSTGVWLNKPEKFQINPILTDDIISGFEASDPATKGIISQMSQNERFQLYYTIRELLPKKNKPVRFIEIGSYAGGSLALIYAAFVQDKIIFEGFSIEPLGHPQFHEVMKFLKDKIRHIQKYSGEAVGELEEIFSADGNYPELIFIDGDHSYEGVKRDLLDYFPLLAPGGILMLHDWLPALDPQNSEAILYHHGGSEPGIRRACEEIAEGMYGLTPIDIPLLKPDDPTQTQAHLPIIPGVYSTVRAYRKG